VIHTVSILLFSLIFLGLSHETYAASQTFSASYYDGEGEWDNFGATGIANLSKVVFEPGDDMSSYIAMSTEATVCSNSISESIVDITISSSTGAQSVIGRVVNRNIAT
jgi:hypothetical protein